MLKNDWVGRLGVPIPDPAKFITCKVSVKNDYLLVFIV